MAIDAIAMASGPSQPDWEIKKLGEIAGLNLGRTPRRDVRLYWEDGEIPWVSIADLNNGLVETTKEKISKQAFSETFQSKIVSAGSLLLSFKLTIGKVGILKMDATHNEAIASIQPNPEIIDRDFLFYQLQNLNYDEYLDAYVKGRTLNKEKLQILNIILPPLGEQRAIARVLTTVRQAIEATERVIEATRQLKKAMMKHLFTYGPVPVNAVDGVQLKETEIGWVPAGWSIVKLGDVAEINTGPFGSSLKKEDLTPSGEYKIFEQENVIYNDFLRGENFIDQSKYMDLQRYRVRSGDVLVSRLGTIGHAAIFPDDGAPGIMGSRLIRIRVNSGILSPKFLVLSFSASAVKNQVDAAGHGVVMKGLNTTIIQSLLIPCPSMKEQESIVQILDAVATKEHSEERKLKILKELFQSLLAYLMKGKVRVGINPTEEQISRLVQLEEDICYQEPPTAVEPEFQVIEGSLPILLSAPHGAVHTRNGEPKEEDEFTVGIARLVGEITGASVLYARRRSTTDPNWDRDVPYKQELLKFVREHGVRFVLDIHGASARREFGIAIGTMNGKTCPNEKESIISSLQELGFDTEADNQLSRLNIDKAFTGKGRPPQETVIRFLSDKGVPCIQIELNARLRIPKRKADASIKEPFEGKPTDVLKTINALVAIVRRLMQEYRGAGNATP